MRKIDRQDWPLAAWLVLAGAVMVVWRAATQSFTIDEAFSYQLFLKQDLLVLFTKYDAAYHGIHTWAGWLAKHTLGKAEWALRLPSIAGGLGYLLGAGLLCRKLFGAGWRAAAATVVLTAHPFFADYYSAARGYGAALAFFTWAFLAMLEERPKRAGILLGLSVACNLTFLVPACSVALVYVLFQWRESGAVVTRVKELGGRFVVTSAVLLAAPLMNARGSSFYYGSEDLKSALKSLIDVSLAHSYVELPAWTWVVNDRWTPWLGVLVAVLAVGAIWRRSLALALATAGLLTSVGALVAGHAATGALYPFTRTGIYLIWLFLASLVAAWAWLAGERAAWARGLGYLVGAGAMALAGVFLLQFDTRFYSDFREDAGVAAMMRRVQVESAGQAACIGGSWRYETTVNYYRDRYRLRAIPEMTRTAQPEAGCRFVMLAPEDAKFVEALGLRVLLRDEVSGATLAEAR